MVFVDQTVDAVSNAEKAYCKFLSYSDIKGMNSQKNGFLLSRFAIYMFFSIQELRKKGNLRKNGMIKWQNDFTSDCLFVWDARKKELWITEIGVNFPYGDQDYIGALFVLTQNENYYQGFVLNTDDDIQGFLNVFGMSPVETDRILK
ncbi:MAG: hypothetical protein LIP12_11115 [Clostridiales bacterium]|nr:hypothetical protein [Clostridiales bacterium]